MTTSRAVTVIANAVALARRVGVKESVSGGGGIDGVGDSEEDEAV